MKVRVLYPSAVVELAKKPPKAGDIIDVDKSVGDALIEAGYAEAEKAKAVEQATAAPGEKRQTKGKK